MWNRTWKTKFIDLIKTIAKVTYHNNNKVKKIKFKLDGLYHNDCGPAYISWYENGNKECEEYYIYGNHDGDPAIIYWYENGNKQSETYYKDTVRHNDNGPAIIIWNEDGSLKHEQYCLFDRFISFKEYNKYIK